MYLKVNYYTLKLLLLLEWLDKRQIKTDKK